MPYPQKVAYIIRHNFGQAVNRLIIGIAGKDGVGKSTLADWLVEQHNFEKHSFATPFKSMLTAMGVPNRYVHIDKDIPVPELGRTARYMERTLAQEWGREKICEHIWIYAFEKRIAAKGPPIVIDDLRFDAEAKYIKRVGGSVVELRRDGFYDNTLKRFFYGLLRLRHVSNRGVSLQYIDKSIWAETPDKARVLMQDHMREVLRCRLNLANGVSTMKS